MNNIDISMLKEEELRRFYEILPHMDDHEINVLYHYTNINGLKGILEHKKFWVSHAHFLNDKTEINYTLDLSNKVFEEFCEKLPKKKNISGIDFSKKDLTDYLKEYYDAIIESIFHQQNYSIYTLSFCTNGDSNLLWSNYSNNDGYCIQVNYQKLIGYLNKKSEFKDLVNAGRVIYDKQVQKKLLEEIFEKLFVVIKTILNPPFEPSEAIRHIAFLLRQYSIFFKDECFSQEEEFRIAISLPNDFENYLCRVSNGVFIPYIEADFEKDCVEGITVGPKNNMDISIDGLKQFLKLNQFNSIQDKNILKSSIPYRY